MMRNDLDFDKSQNALQTESPQRHDERSAVVGPFCSAQLSMASCWRQHGPGRRAGSCEKDHSNPWFFIHSFGAGLHTIL